VSTEISVVTQTTNVDVASQEREVTVIEVPGGVRGPSGFGGARGAYGSFFDRTDQPASTAAGIAVALGETLEADGITIENGSEIVFERAGVYSLTFSLQFTNTDNVPRYADVWVRYQGENFPDSATRFDIPARKSQSVPGHMVGTVNYVATAEAGGRVEIMWIADSAQVGLETYAASEAPDIPAVPSVILTVTQVMYTQVGPQGPEGEKGDTGDVNPEMYVILQAAEDARDAAAGSEQAAAGSADAAFVAAEAADAAFQQVAALINIDGGGPDAEYVPGTIIDCGVI
jgi:hypothetical protein